LENSLPLTNFGVSAVAIGVAAEDIPLTNRTRVEMAKLFKVCLDIEGNDKGLTVTTVAADTKEEAITNAKNHVGTMNQNYRERKIAVKGCKEVGRAGCISDDYIPRDWMTIV
jgi:hypothetical protein